MSQRGLLTAGHWVVFVLCGIGAPIVAVVGLQDANPGAVLLGAGLGAVAVFVFSQMWNTYEFAEWHLKAAGDGRMAVWGLTAFIGVAIGLVVLIYVGVGAVLGFLIVGAVLFALLGGFIGHRFLD